MLTTLGINMGEGGQILLGEWELENQLWKSVYIFSKKEVWVSRYRTNMWHYSCGNKDTHILIPGTNDILTLGTNRVQLGEPMWFLFHSCFICMYVDELCAFLVLAESRGGHWGLKGSLLKEETVLLTTESSLNARGRVTYKSVGEEVLIETQITES